MSITELDEQCIRGQTGVLCGACKPGLSHILGLSHECRKCSNKKLYLYIIPSRLISGLFILFILTVLNVTVTEGTINGLIFYGTFLAIYMSKLLFYTHHVWNRFSRTFWVFIAWLNLDSGFDACAYDGMTGYQYIWLTFGFVFHLLIIQALMIILSRKFIF